MTRKGILLAVGVWAALSLASTARSEDVRLALAWVPFGKHAFFYAAMERGIYTAEGFSLKLLPGKGGMDAITKVASGAAEFGSGGLDTLVVARARGTKVKALGIWHDKGFNIIYYLKGSGIQKPKDLEGRSIGGPIWQDTRVLFPAFAVNAKLDPTKVRWVDMTPAALAQSLVTSKVDAITTFSIQEPILERLVSKQGKKLGAFDYADYGLDLYSNGILATDERIQKNPEQVRRFVRATYKGMTWGVEHPQEALSIFLKKNPTSDLEIARAQFKIAIDHLMTPIAKANGIGYISEEKMRLTRDVITKYMKLPRVVPTEELYTNDFLPKIFPKPAP